jgi:hypothetical protein
VRPVGATQTSFSLTYGHAKTDRSEIEGDGNAVTIGSHIWFGLDEEWPPPSEETIRQWRVNYGLDPSLDHP